MPGRFTRTTAAGGFLVLLIALVAATAGASSVSAATTARSSSSAARTTAAFEVLRHPGTIHLEDDGAYTLRLGATNGVTWTVGNAEDVTRWFTTAGGAPTFTDTHGVARAQVEQHGHLLVIRLDASKIHGFTSNGSGRLFLRPAAGAIRLAHGGSRGRPVLVGDYVIPELDVDSDLFGSAYTHGKSTLKKQFGQDITYDPDTGANLRLKLPGLRNSKIDSSAATVQLSAGDGYYPAEYTLGATTVAGRWAGGETTYQLGAGDLAINTGGYPLDDANSGREWSCLGGDGQGNYYFNLTVSGIRYRGLPVASQTFPLHVYVYGYDYTSDAAALYGAGSTVQPTFAPLSTKVANPPAPAAKPLWTWVGPGGEPNVADAVADDFYVTWPRRADASAVGRHDVTVILHADDGRKRVLTAGQDYSVTSSRGESQIAVTLQNWSFEPVYSSLSISVDGGAVRHLGAARTTASYDIASVYAYEAQQGGGGATVDGTVTAYSFYGLANLTSATQVFSPVTYSLSAAVDGQTKYYAEDGSGHPVLVDTAAAAKTYDGSGADDRNLQLIGNTVYITTRLNQTDVRAVDGRTITFTKSYGGGRLLAPTASDQGLEARPGYVIPWGTPNWVTHEKWAWQGSIAQGWTGIDVEPYTGKFVWSVAKGATQQFTADDPSVVWSIQGAHVAAGTTISPTGLLTVAPGESASTFAVVATSTADASPEGKGAVNVTVTAPSP